ncbi:ABC transporter permease [candidate division KSB1 bacterium]|nr:ABC transporter permease [candidate division KSB1 bacterium]RQW10185.1 MAG: ABC transporter permease [candidate division KSB1 bacterium]
MHSLLAFIHKEFLHILRDTRTLVILFGIPTAQIMIFGYVIRMDIREAQIAVLDLSRDEITRQLIHKFDASEFFCVSHTLNSMEEVDFNLKTGTIKQVLAFEAGFGARLMREGVATMSLIIDASEPNTGRLIASYSQAIVSEFNRELAAPGSREIAPAVRMIYNPALRDEFMFVPGLITLILMLICALMTSITITREKEFGSMEVLLVSPLRPLQIIIGKVAPYLVLAFGDVLLILALANFVFGLPVTGSLALLLLESILYISLALSLGILISTVSKTMQQAMFISLIGLMLPSILLSGFIFPLENMPLFYQIISLILPPRWFIAICKSIMLKGVGLRFVWKETLILIAMTALFIGISAKKFKTRLE